MNKKATLEVVQDYHMIKNNMQKELYYDWLFQYNPYEKAWYAFERENFTGYFSDKENTKYLRGSSVDELIEIIDMIDGQLFRNTHL